MYFAFRVDFEELIHNAPSGFCLLQLNPSYNCRLTNTLAGPNCRKSLWTTSNEFISPSITSIAYLVDITCFNNIFGIKNSMYRNNISLLELFVENAIRGAVLRSSINTINATAELSLDKLLHSVMQPSYISTIPVFWQQQQHDETFNNPDLLLTNAAVRINDLNLSHIFYYENISCIRQVIEY